MPPPLHLPVYKLSISALRAIFGDQPAATVHPGPRPWVEYEGRRYDMPPDKLRERMLARLTRNIDSFQSK